MQDDEDEYNPNIESYRDYRERITTMADVIEDRLDEDPDAEVAELVWEEVDSSRIAIYTHEGLQALRHSDEGPQEWKHLVEDGASWQKVVQALAFDAARNDLWDELNRREVDQ